MPLYRDVPPTIENKINLAYYHADSHMGTWAKGLKNYSLQRHSSLSKMY